MARVGKDLPRKTADTNVDSRSSFRLLPSLCNSLVSTRQGQTGEARVAGPFSGDWLSGRAPRSHRGGHWFDPSIAHPSDRRPLPTQERGPGVTLMSAAGPSPAGPAFRSVAVWVVVPDHRSPTHNPDRGSPTDHPAGRGEPSTADVAAVGWWCGTVYGRGKGRRAGIASRRAGDAARWWTGWGGAWGDRPGLPGHADVSV